MAGEPYYDYVSALLHCNGTNGSTTITDSSANALTYTAAGNAQLDTSIKKYGTASILFDGAGDYVSSASNAALTLGTGQFTVEAWIYPTAVGSVDHGIISMANVAGSGNLVIRIGTASKIQYWLSAPASLQNGSSTISASAWTHIALVRDAAKVRLFVNGTMEVETTTDLSSNLDKTQIFIGRDYSNYDGEYFTGNIDDIRITKGYARYTANFTPPTAEFGDSQLTFSGNITESTDVTDWRITATRCADGVCAGTTTASGTSYTLACRVDKAVCDLHIEPKIDYYWTASKVVTLNDYCVPSNPDTTPRLYKATSIGSSPHQTHSTTEPTWPTSGTVADGDITWTFVINLDDGLFKTLGTKIPA